MMHRDKGITIIKNFEEQDLWKWLSPLTPESYQVKRFILKKKKSRFIFLFNKQS